MSILSIFSVSLFPSTGTYYSKFNVYYILHHLVVCGITAEYSDLNLTPPTEVIFNWPDTNQGLSRLGLDQNGRKGTSGESINVQVHLYSNCLFILMAQLLPNINFLFSNSRWTHPQKPSISIRYQINCPKKIPPRDPIYIKVYQVTFSYSDNFF